MSKVLAGKVAIVTGASGGIGLCTTKTFLEAGAFVLGVDLSPAPKDVAQGENFSFIQVNLTDDDAPSKILDAAQSAFPNQGIDILANIAGIADLFQGIHNIQDEIWDKVMNINVKAPVRLTREVIKVMQKQGSGNIVNVASKAGTCGATHGLAYGASKAALISVTQNTAWLYKEEGIRCNAVAPGLVRTQLEMPNVLEQTGIDMPTFMKVKPVLDVHFNSRGVPLMPEQIAQSMLFLASDLSRGITGIVLPVDEGYSVI